MTLSLFGIAAKWGWAIADEFSDRFDPMLPLLRDIAVGKAELERWVPPPVAWDGESSEPYSLSDFYGSVAYRPDADDGLDHYFGRFPLLPLGGDGEGWFVPYLGREQVQASFLGRAREGKLDLKPGLVRPGLITIASTIGLVCADTQTPAQITDNPADCGLRSWTLSRNLSGVQFVELWSADGKATWRALWASEAHREPASAATGVASAVPDSPALEVASDGRAAIEAYVELRVAAGESAAGIIEALRSGADDLIRDLDGFVAAAIQTHVEAQALWPAVTDVDRLELAFSALEGAGIVARIPFTDRSHASGEILNEIDEALVEDKDARGFVFASDQDVEIAIEGYGLRLSSGARRENDDAASVMIATEVVAALRAQGLEVEWGGGASHAVRVSLQWQRRRAHT